MVEHRGVGFSLGRGNCHAMSRKLGSTLRVSDRHGWCVGLGKKGCENPRTQCANLREIALQPPEEVVGTEGDNGGGVSSFANWESVYLGKC